MGGSNKMDLAYPAFLGFEGTSLKLATLVSGPSGYESQHVVSLLTLGSFFMGIFISEQK